MPSPSSRRAWIEIPGRAGLWSAATVALLAEGVDRNYLHTRHIIQHTAVALREEGVDRNIKKALGGAA